MGIDLAEEGIYETGYYAIIDRLPFKIHELTQEEREILNEYCSDLIKEKKRYSMFLDNKKSNCMNSIQDWAEYYRQNRLWVFPCNSGNTSMSYWKYWRDLKEPQYLKQYEDYIWNEAEGVKVVVGKKGIRVLILNGIENEKSKTELLYRVLALLNLPVDYSWIIEIGNSLAIIIDTPSDVIGMGNRTYAECLLLWEGSFAMPSSSNNRQFYKNRLPAERPVQIKNELLFVCIKDILNRYSTKDKYEISHQSSEEATAEATKRVSGLTYKYNDLYRNFVQIGSIIWLLVGGAICFYFISGFFIALITWLFCATLIYAVVVFVLRMLKENAIKKYVDELPEDEMVRIITNREN